MSGFRYEYAVVNQSSPGDLENHINFLAENGWYVTGGPMLTAFGELVVLMERPRAEEPSEEG